MKKRDDDNLGPFTMDNVERLSGKLVGVQILIEEMKNTLEEQYQCKRVDPVESELHYDAGPPKRFNIVVPLFPPKIQISAGKAYKPYPFYYAIGTRDIWDATILKLFQNNKEKCEEAHSIHKAIVWITYFFPNKIKYNLNNLATKFIIYPLANYFLFCAKDNRMITIILTGDTDKDRPRTEINITEDMGQLKMIKNGYPKWDDF